MDLKSTYDKIAEDWSKDHADDDWWLDGTDYFLSLLPRGASILDVGCGAGVKSQYLQERGFEVAGIDFSPKMIEIAQRRVPQGKFAVKDIKEPLGFKKEFDAVFAQAVLLHIPKKEVESVLNNLTRALKPGGYLYIAVKQLRDGARDEEMVRENDYGYEYERFFSYFTLPEIEEYIKKIDLRLIWKNVSQSHGTNWIQVIAR